ncbi:MAG: hypothetical protein AVDCRST_MAG59-3191, partial [uncultured Thermomicrobiales bacterium]
GGLPAHRRVAEGGLLRHHRAAAPVGGLGGGDHRRGQRLV